MASGGFRGWQRDHKLAFWSIIATLLVGAVTGVVVPLALSGGGGNSAKVVTNNGQVNVGGVVNNYYSGTSPAPASCPSPTTSPAGSKQDVSVDLYVRPLTPGACWTRAIVSATSPALVEYEVEYTNTSKVTQNDVEIRFKLAKGMTMISHSTYLANSSSPQGRAITSTDAVTTDGILIGNYTPGANAFVLIMATTPAPADLACGSNLFRTEVFAQPKNVNFFDNTSDVTVSNGECGK